MDTLSPDALPDPSSVYAAAALQERRFHVLKNDDNFAIFDSIGDILAAPAAMTGCTTATPATSRSSACWWAVPGRCC